MVTKPLVVVSMTILPFIEDTSRFNLLTQSCDMNECITPVSMIATKELPFMKHVPQIKLSDLKVSTPVRDALACATPITFFYFWHWVVMWPCSPQLKQVRTILLQSSASCPIFPYLKHISLKFLHSEAQWPMKHLRGAEMSPPLVFTPSCDILLGLMIPFRN